LLAWLPGEEDIPPRVAYAVGRKVGGAVTRNRVRRRLRASVARYRSHLRPGAAYLFGAGREAATAPFAELEVAVGELLAGRPQ
jgi:ribonuclease P protein component